MTPAEIDGALRRIISESGDVAKDIRNPGGERVLAACVSLLSVVLAEQEKRLRALEPCRKNVDGLHVYLSSGVCGYCGVGRP